MEDLCEQIVDILHENAFVNPNRCEYELADKIIALFPQWINVEDELPEEEDIILMYRKGYGVNSVLMNGRLWRAIKPTHWMPLLQPPRED